MNISVLGVDAPLKKPDASALKALGGRNVASNPEGKNMELQLFKAW